MAAVIHLGSAQDFDEFYAELNDIKQNKAPREDDGHASDDEILKTDDGDEERTWLQQAGYGHHINTIEAGDDLNELQNEISTLTQPQATAVKKRVETLRSTVGRTKKHTTKVDVRDIFSDPTHGRQSQIPPPVQEGPHKTLVEHRNDDARQNRNSDDVRRKTSFLNRRSKNYDMGGDSKEVPTKGAGVEPLSMHTRGPVTVYVGGSNLGDALNDPAYRLSHNVISNDDIRLNVPQGDRDTKRTPTSDFLGVTRIDDISVSDKKKVQTLAFIELSSLFDKYNIRYMRRKKKKKMKEHGLFGVPLQSMLEHDQKRFNLPSLRVPLVYKQFIQFLEQDGLKEEGILRVPGSVARVKSLRQELEEKFHSQQFKWVNVRASDAASLLKQFLRELPVPLLSNEYLDAFSQIEKIKDPEEQMRVLNLLVILLPDVNRDSLLLLLMFLESVANNRLNNKMNINNVSMIMAPNLFLVQSGSKQTMQMEVNMAAGTSNTMRWLIKYQARLWEVPEDMMQQIRRQYEAENNRKLLKEKKKRYGKKDKAELYKKTQVTEGDFSEPVIQVEAPQLVKFCTAIQLEPGTLASDIVAKCKRGSGLASQRESGGSVQNGRRGSSEDELNDPDLDNMYLYEIGGNIGKRRVDNNANMMSLYRANPTATWVIECWKPL